MNIGHIVHQDGMVIDGFDGATNDLKDDENNDEWTYNFGAFLGATSEFYTITGDIQYMKTGQKVVEAAFGQFNTTGYFMDIISYNSDGDAFKGIFFKYMSKFLVQYWKTTPLDD